MVILGVILLTLDVYLVQPHLIVIDVILLMFVKYVLLDFHSIKILQEVTVVVKGILLLAILKISVSLAKKHS